MMRFAIAILAAAALLSGSAYAAETIRVGVTAGPHAEITEVVKKVAAERGLDIKLVEFTDYVFRTRPSRSGISKRTPSSMNPI
jgi:D-methionine transport system substrate-binding protein